jgi:hypothetical protein
MRRLLKGVMVIATGAVLTTLLALEGGGVVQVRTVNAQTQQPRDTRIWFVGNGAQIVLEAGKPENHWMSCNEILCACPAKDWMVTTGRGFMALTVT